MISQINPQQFRNKKTGEIKTLLKLSELKDYEKIELENELRGYQTKEQRIKANILRKVEEENK